MAHVNPHQQQFNPAVQNSTHRYNNHYPTDQRILSFIDDYGRRDVGQYDGTTALQDSRAGYPSDARDTSPSSLHSADHIHETRRSYNTGRPLLPDNYAYRRRLSEPNVTRMAMPVNEQEELALGSELFRQLASDTDMAQDLEYQDGNCFGVFCVDV